ncbi:uncharacterized protein LOC123560007 [Mercenaria mercenaria]|uniref:uncharacterized protein LOC123560007 n=1 Tax=Mercenaria mercenaria TaxID=6596 RepID=UPI00234EA22B|nr:uncharacterized protein LOC123560007 [Mercenaria mercenaria]
MELRFGVDADNMSSAERQYWRRKLPAKFQLLLERLGRVIVRENPTNLLEFAAKYLEEKLLEEQAELKALPEHSYLKQLLEKRFPPVPSIPPRNDSDADHAEAVLASAIGRFISRRFVCNQNYAEAIKSQGDLIYVSSDEQSKMHYLGTSNTFKPG